MTRQNLPRKFAWRLVGLLRAFTRRRPSHRDLTDEIQGFLESLTTKHVEAGLPPEEARRAALLEIGGIEAVKEDTMAVHPAYQLATFARDVVIGIRALRRVRIFSTIVVATLALSVGVTVTMFSVMRTE